MNAVYVKSIGLLPIRKKRTDASFRGRLYQSLNFLTQHCYEPIGIGDLANASNLSRRGLHKAFRRHIGQSPGRALRSIRIERAKALLANSGLNQKIIAQVCGYRSVNSFWVSFRAIVGQSPGQFRLHSRKRPRNIVSHGAFPLTPGGFGKIKPNPLTIQKSARQKPGALSAFPIYGEASR